MARLGIGVTLALLLGGTAAQAQNVDVDAFQSVSVTAGIASPTTFTDSVAGPNGALQNIYAPSGTGAGASGGAYDTFVTTTPSTVSFQAANSVAGPRVTATSTTVVDLSFKNGANFIENGVLESTITPAGLGFYVANIGVTGACLYTSCSSEGAAPFTTLTSSLLGPTGAPSLELGTVGVAFQVFRGENTLFDVHGSMTLFTDGETFWVDDEDLVANLSFLDGFGKSTADGSDKAYGYAWDGKDVEINYGSLNPFEDVTLTYLTRVTSTASAFCAGNADCLLAFAGFGDPIGRGGGVDALSAASLFGGELFLEAFGGGALNATSGEIDGVTFTGATFDLPTFDPETGRVTFVAAEAVPEPGAWALMILGFGAVGSVLRRRRVLGACV